MSGHLVVNAMLLQRLAQSLLEPFAGARCRTTGIVFLRPEGSALGAEAVGAYLVSGGSPVAASSFEADVVCATPFETDAVRGITLGQFLSLANSTLL